MSSHVHFEPCDAELAEKIGKRVEVREHSGLSACVGEETLSFGLVANGHRKASFLAKRDRATQRVRLGELT